jgi:hypothetical protein
MKIEHTEVFGFRAALRGMRNPMDSWHLSDSYVRTPSGLWRSPHGVVVKQPWGGLKPEPFSPALCVFEEPAIGPDDLALAVKLIKQGGDHRKFLRYIIVECDFVIPRYVWQEVDTYKVGTVRNSCSTMNTLGKRHLTQEDFQNGLPEFFLEELNRAVDEFQEAGKGASKRESRVILKDLLPEGFLQRATMLWNYEVGFRAFFSRRKHRLPMWREGCEGSICEWIKSWPYMEYFLGLKEI